MNKELEKDLIEDLEKSGFSSELRAIRTFLSSGWKCTGFANFFDLDQEQITAVDLRSINSRAETLPNEMQIEVQFIVDAEVKKSEKPWIVFREPNDYIFDDYINNLVHLHNLNPPFMLKDAMAQHSLYSQFGWKAYGIHESFKKPDTYSRSYSAMVKVCKSAEHTLRAYSAAYKGFEQLAKESDTPLTDRVLLFVKPVVILAGTLVAANLSEQGEITLEEVKFAPLEFFHKSKSCHKGVYLVDLVTLNNLKEYIQILENRAQTIYEKIKQITLKNAT